MYFFGKLLFSDFSSLVLFEKDSKASKCHCISKTKYIIDWQKTIKTRL